jgi:thymidylate synthase (FAD)
VWNEVSRRYVDDEPEFYIPKNWRKRPKKSIKQGSSDETVELDILSTIDFCKQTYENLLNAGVAPEMARMILPQNMYTEWYWSGTLYAFARVCNLRCKPDAQVETQMVAKQIHELTKEKFPNSWEALIDYDK